MKLEEKILALRKKRGLSQEGLAKRLKVTRQAVYKWEAGISRPELDKILAIAQLFNVSSDTLIDDKIKLDIENIEIEEKEETYNKDETVNIKDNNSTLEEPLKNQKSSKRLKILISLLIIGIIVAIIIGSIFILNGVVNESTQQDKPSGDTQNSGNTQFPGGQTSGETEKGTETQGKPVLKPDDKTCVHVYKLVSFTDQGHIKKCDSCGEKIEEKHAWEDGKCTYCSYYPLDYSQGLEFEKVGESEEYALVSIGINKENHVKIPPTFNGLPVTRINMYAFDDCSRVTKITVPVSIKYIEGNAFLGAGDSKNNTAYYEMARLQLYYEGTLFQWMKIFFGVHSNTGNTVLYINETAVKDLIIPEEIEEIGPNTFNFMMFDSVTIGSNVKRIRQNAFYFADIHKLVIEEGLEEIGDSAFYYASDFDEIAFPKTLKKIGRFAFYGTKITLLTLPDCVEYLGDSAFALCNKLLRASLGSGLCYIGSNAFYSCDNLNVLGMKVEGVYDIYDSSNIKLGTMDGEKLSKDPYLYMVWRNPEYTYIKQGYEQ